jgi:heat shock protein HtpX
LDDEDSGFGGLSIWGYWILVWVLEVVFMIFAYMLISWFSRKREYAADMYSSGLVGKDKMIASLESLKKSANQILPKENKRDSIVFSKISNSKKIYFFETHTYLDDRINYIKNN